MATAAYGEGIASSDSGEAPGNDQGREGRNTEAEGEGPEMEARRVVDMVEFQGG